MLSNGSVIHVYENQFMILTDGGKIVDYTAEPGYYTIEDLAQPSMFSGQFGDALRIPLTVSASAAARPSPREFTM